MSQNPYANYGNTTYETAPDARTSVLAIMSLVTALSCCLSFLGPILGGAALVRISSSGGRRKGAGLAIAGIIIGLVITVIEIAFFWGAAALAKQGMQVTFTPIIKAVSVSDPNEFRATLSPTLSPQVSDADFKKFKASIEAELGTLQPGPSTLFGLVKEYMELGQQMNRGNSGTQNVMPVPLTGDKGRAVLWVHMAHPTRVNGRNGGNMTPGAEILSSAVNFSATLPSGTEVWLIDPNKVLPGPTPAPKNNLPPGSTPPTPPPSPAEQPNGV